jgi:hypothetical protein
LRELRACGAGRNECVAYWVGPADDAAFVDAVVHPEHTATPAHYEIDQTWLHHFWLGLARTSRCVRVQVHTHGGRAGHSLTDDRWPLVHTAGFLSLVVPHFAAGASHGNEMFLAELDSGGIWRSVSPRERLPDLP